MGLLKVDILGSSFELHANEDDEYLSKLLSYYKQIITEVEKTDHLKDPKKTAILSGILLVDELYKEKEKNARLLKNSASSESADDDEINSITGDLISQIEKVL
ncbi:MAG: cell division protein ZapA [Treponema sp.]|uniref:cell division protein ZapA n=1 Tax=Treponema sp. TaxID=166 RepID=UPI00298D6BD1|nr:cell division protein ZapA [Treponema sp.]MBR5934222.1 cell division protein ZapA [Treponema sp.]